MQGTNDFEKYVYEPVDLCACYEPLYDPPPEQEKEWELKWKQQLAEAEQSKQKCYYGTDESGVTYFYFGKERIRVTEHFADRGQTYCQAAEEAIRYAIRNAGSRPSSIAS
ncbi:MAG: hypothetical protein LUE92_04290 [Clostridiales bacterium]|nr:hypothetical protein [Clostridiales bacterium]